MNKIEVPTSIIELAKLFSPYAKLYVVGGYVRDYLLFNKKSKDIDICSQLKPNEVENILKGTKFEIYSASKRLGTVLIKVKGEHYFEYTTFRIDSYPEESGDHNPLDVKFTNDINVDARRRDFKVNAIYYDVIEDEIVDPLGGIEDLNEKKLSTVINPNVVLSQDGLRIMRLVRFVAKLNFDIERKTLDSAKALVCRLKDISVERIVEEFKLLLKLDYSYKALKIMKELDIIKMLFLNLIDLEKISDECYNNQLEFIFKEVECVDDDLKLAVFFSKALAVMKKTDLINLINHYKFSNDEKKLIEFFAENRDFYLSENLDIYTIRLFIVNNLNYIEKYFSFIEKDLLVKKSNKTLKDVELYRQYEYMRENCIPMTFKDLAISGKILLGLGYKGKVVGELLKEMLTLCIKGTLENSKNSLLEYVNKRG